MATFTLFTNILTTGNTIDFIYDIENLSYSIYLVTEDKRIDLCNITYDINDLELFTMCDNNLYNASFIKSNLLFIEMYTTVIRDTMNFGALTILKDEAYINDIVEIVNKIDSLEA